MTHSVYHLFDPFGKLVYVGRGKNPARRRYDFEHRTGVSVSLKVFRVFITFEQAQACELRQIKEHAPPYNLYLASSPCMLGHRHTDETKRKISKAQKASAHAVGNQHALGYKHTAKTREIMSQKRRARPPDPSVGAKISEKLKGKPKSPEAVAKMKEAQQQRRLRERATS